MSRPRIRVVVETVRGVVSNVYTDAKDLEVVVVDWPDDVTQEPDASGTIKKKPLGKTPLRTMRAVKESLGGW